MNLTFFLYVIKDALEFTGFYPITTPSRKIKNSLYKFDVFTAKSEEITKYQEML